ncbi:MAG: UDP-N-acetylmuramoyl-tripeptide--D-alanyl-D-alanine ligase [Alphaproteobacteria bacterium]|nr:UDP-N-acetylmuramoyl-tripeptide--D-alanyl-D-alanine ligase [Alphaproteobacteria bacterium]
MTALWSAADAFAATGGKTSGEWSASGISIDTRSLERGDLFIALKDARDGHDFVSAALARGAAAAMVSRVPEGLAPDAPLLIVNDVQTALEALATAARARSGAKVIAITGSVGKTSTKDMLAHVLARQGATHAAAMSLNNHWGVPLTLARMPEKTEFAVIEVGMNHPGEISPLAKLARPNVALITTVAEAHMAAFHSVHEIAKAKAELLDGLEAVGRAILNHDNEYFDFLATQARAAGAQITSFGADAQADYRLKSYRVHGVGTIVEAEIGGELTAFKIGAPGRHLAMNALAVLGAVAAVGADIAIAGLDLADWQPPAGRGARHWIALDPVEANLRLELIDEAYNANPVSMEAALEGLAATSPVDGIGRVNHGRRLAFLTDMLELGADEAEKHRSLAVLPSIEKLDLVHTAGVLMKQLHLALPPEKRGEWHDSAKKLAERAHHLLDAGDVVMVKGSKGSRASLVVDAIKKLGRANQQ